MTNSLTKSGQAIKYRATDEDAGKIALECIQKVKLHLERAYQKTGDKKFSDKLNYVNLLIRQYQMNQISYGALTQLGLAS